MPPKITERLGEFVAHDHDGRKRTIVVFKNFVETIDLDGAEIRVPGIRLYRTAGGQSVNCLGEDKFQIVGESGVLTCIGPGIP